MKVSQNIAKCTPSVHTLHMTLLSNDTVSRKTTQLYFSQLQELYGVFQCNLQHNSYFVKKLPETFLLNHHDSCISYLHSIILHVVPENIHTHPMEGHWKFLGGSGDLKSKFF